MNNKRGFSHVGVATKDLDKTREFYEHVLGFKLVVADRLKIEEGSHLRHIFFDVGRDQLLAFMQAVGVPQIPRDFDARLNRGLGVPAAFYHSAFEAGSPAALAEKRDALRAKGVEATGIVAHNWTQFDPFQGSQRPAAGILLPDTLFHRRRCGGAGSPTVSRTRLGLDVDDKDLDDDGLVTWTPTWITSS